jgi:phospholipid/cholesterol/gamma-HCH transport system ATP-binding protein
VTAGPAIEIRGLSTRFGSLLVHEDLDLEVRRGEVLALVGGSGSGKTTLLREIIMLLEPSGGSIRLLGEELTGIGEDAALRLRRRFGVLFQMGALFSSLTVLENVMVPLREHTGLPKEWLRELAALKMAQAGLPAHAADKLPRQLSGGMLKRASLARALALDPELMFLDEPTSGLDPLSAGALDELVLQLKESLGLTIVMVTHDLDSLWRTTDRVAFLGERRVIGLAPMRELVQSPHPVIRDYFDCPRAQAAGVAYRAA